MSEQLPKEKQLLDLLIASAYAAYCSSLIGGPPIAHERFQFFKEFKPGDLVMEVSSMFQRRLDPIRIGYLVSDAMEPFGTEEWWEENKEDYEGERPQERVFTIKSLLDEEEKRWTNAMMIRVVTKIAGEFP
jgi:hypothetical protein